MHKILKDTLEAKVKENLVELCKKHNALAEHNFSGNRFTRPGRCDYTILTSDGRTLYVECKKPKGKLEPVQEIYRKSILDRKGSYLLYDGLNDDELEGFLK